MTSDVGGGEAERNPTGGTVTGRRQRDLNSIHAVMLLSAQVAEGQLHPALLSVDEIRAIAKLAIGAAIRCARAEQ